MIFFYIPFPFSLIPECPVTEIRLACDIFVGECSSIMESYLRGKFRVHYSLIVTQKTPNDLPNDTADI